MIFFTVGTTSFEGLVKAADKLKLPDEIIIQKGPSEYVPRTKKYFEFGPEFADYVKQAEVVVTHGGAGTLFELVNLGKKVVGVANEERSDLHQWDILKKLSDDGHIIWCKSMRDLGKCIQKAKEYEPKKYVRPECTIGEEIINRYAKS